MNYFNRQGFAFPMPLVPKSPGLQKAKGAPSPLPQTVSAFVLRYIAVRRWHFLGVFGRVVGAAICVVLVQVGMKALVDAMAGATERQASGVWPLLAIFIGLIAIESILWRASGWVGSRTVIASGVDIRLDLYRHLAN